MTTKEQGGNSEVTPQAIYSKATEILDLYGQSGIRQTLRIDNTPWRAARIRLRQGPNVQTRQALAPIEISGNEYRLWLQQSQEGKNSEFQLSVHFQKMPFGFNRYEYDDKGRISAYWYKSPDQEELKRTEVARSWLGADTPKELQAHWYIAHTYWIGQNSIKSEPSPKAESDIASPLKRNKEFILNLLEQMKTELEQLEIEPQDQPH